MNKLPLAANTRLNNTVAPFLKRAPAVAIAVFHQDELIISKTWGNVDTDTGLIPLLNHTRFDLASLTKLFTTSAFLSLVSEGRVRIDDPLVSVVPEFGTITPRAVDGGQDPHTKEKLPTPPENLNKTVDPALITFRHLLTHTSGLAAWRDVFNAAGPAPTPPQDPDPVTRGERWRRAVEALCAYPFVSHPDGVVRYSDLGLMLLGEAVARLHGAQLDIAIQARVLAPLGLNETLFNPIREGGLNFDQVVPTEIDPTWRKRRVWGEVHDENACGVGGVAGHAGLFSTALDVARFGQAWLEGSIGIDLEIRKEAVSQQAVTEGERRGLGWMLKSYENSSAGEKFSPDSFGHTGFTGTSLWIEPRARLVVALMTNAVYEGRATMQTHPFRRAINTLFYDLLAE